MTKYDFSPRSIRKILMLIDDDIIPICSIRDEKANKFMIDILLYKQFINTNKDTYIDWDKHDMTKNLNDGMYLGIGNRLMKDGEILERNYKKIFLYLLDKACDGDVETMDKKFDVLCKVAEKHLNNINLQ